jgi:heterodisulfide reductase subunit A
MRGRVAEITEGSDNNPIVTYENTHERKVESQEFDMVILATACAPTKAVFELAKILGIELE